MKTVLVTGANGQLGNELRLLSKGLPYKFVFTDVVQSADTTILDITDIEAIRKIVAEEKVDVIVNCAAFTNVDAAEDNETIAELINSKAVENLAVAAKENNALLIHISTDYVFDGTAVTPYTEEDKCNPTGAYGRTKLHGEEAVERVGCKSIIIRTAWLYSEFGKNFVKTMLNLTATKPAIKVVNDQVGTPTYALDLAKVIVKFISMDSDSLLGTYHFSNEGVCSWYDFAVKIAALAGNTECKINPCLSSEYPSKVKRPAYSVLDKNKIKMALNITIPAWEESLAACLGKRYEAPNSEILNMNSESIICTSPENLGNPEDRETVGDWGNF